jgi:DNA-binding IclR family transcriptional regulator
MLNDQSEIIIKRARRARDAAPALRSFMRPGAPRDPNVKSAARALEVIDLFGVHRHPLSVTEIATALAIPQSCSSMLLYALSSIGFVTRDRKTLKYLPGIRFVFLGNWIHDAISLGGGLRGALDALSGDASANVRLGVRSGVDVRYVHVHSGHIILGLRRSVSPRPFKMLWTRENGVGRRALAGQARIRSH